SAMALASCTKSGCSLAGSSASFSSHLRTPRLYRMPRSPPQPDQRGSPKWRSHRATDPARLRGMEEPMRPIVLVLLAAACGSSVQPPAASAPSPALRDRGDNPNPVLFEKDAHPYGASMVTWGERASQWMWG